MTNSKDYRLYLESEFREIHKKLDSNEIQLDRIELQTTKTNGCVSSAISEISELKNQRDKYLETRVSKDMLENVKSAVEVLDKEIHQLKEDLVEYNFLRRYPKLSVVVIAIFVVAMSFSVYGTFKTISSSISIRDIQRIENAR